MAYTPLASRRAKSETPRLEIENPGRGLNSLVSDNMIDDREASDLQNIWFTEAGAVTKRNGYHAVGTGLSNNPRGLGTYMDSSGGKYLVTIDGTALKYLKDSFAAASTYTSAGGGVTFTAGNQATFTSARGSLFIWNGVEGGSYFDGTNVTRPGTMPKGKFSLYYKGYHFASGVDGQLNRLYIAVATDATDFTNAATTLHDSTEVPGATVFAGTGANFIDIDKDDGDKITALATFQDSVIVFKERSIHQVTLDASGTPSVALITRSLGAVSHKSVETVENDVFFLSRRGIFVLGNEPNFFNAIRTNELSSRVHDDFQLISSANLGLSTAIFHNYHYHLAVPEGGTTTNNVMWSYDRRFLAWSKTKPSSLGAESFTTLIDNNNIERVFFTASDEAQIYEIDNNFSDNGTAIDASWTSKAFDIDTPDLQKRWVYVDLLFRQLSGGISISIFTDGDELAATASIPSPATGGDMGTMLLGEELLGGDPADQVLAEATTINVPYRIPIRKNARTLKVKVSNSVDNENFVLLGIYIGYFPYSQWKFDSANKLTVS